MSITSKLTTKKWKIFKSVFSEHRLGLRTVTWHSGERNVQVDRQLFSSAFVDNDRGIDVNSSVVEEFDHCD